LLVVDEAHNLEAQLVGVFTLTLAPEEMKAWFGAPLPRLGDAADYRPMLAAHRERLEGEREALDRALEALRPPDLPIDLFLGLPPSSEEQALLAQRDELAGMLTRLAFFVDGGEREWIVRYPLDAGAALELVPLSIAPLAAELLAEAAELVVLSSAYLGHRAVLAEALGLEVERLRSLTVPSPFPVAQRPIVYRPVGVLSKTTLPALEAALAEAIATILQEHPRDKGLVHAPSYATGRRLVRALEARAPLEARRLLWIDAPDLKARALELHRTSPLPTVLVSPSLREGVDLPDDFLRFQILTKTPYPDLGEPWTSARRARDPRWYALETAKALVQAYGRSCRHADDHGVTYVLDGQFARFVQRYRALLPAWFLEAAVPALRRAVDADIAEELD
jgi:Rad3-related DNA helicase